MKKIKLTGRFGVGKVAIVDDEDFEMLSRWRWYGDKRGYARRSCHTPRINGQRKTKHILMHRFIMKATQGQVVDHKNFDTIDNRKINLRIGSQQQNTFNSRKSKNNTSGYKGVFKMSNSKYERYKKWMAQIMFNRKSIFIGYYLTKEEAALAYNQKASELFGEFARLNQL